MIKLFALAVFLLAACSNYSDVRPGAARLGAKIAPTTLAEIAPTTAAEIAPTTSGAGPEIAPTSVPVSEIAPTTGDESLAVQGLATAAAEIAPTTAPKLHQQPQKLHQQDVGVVEQATAIYGGQDDNTTWIAAALLGVFLFLVWAVWVGRVVDRIMRRAR